MSRKEVPRPGLVKLAVAGQITNAQGAQSAHLSIRQFQRLKARYRTGGNPREGYTYSRLAPSTQRVRQHLGNTEGPVVRPLVALVLQRVLAILVRTNEHAKDLEIVVLRHQLQVLRRHVGRPRFRQSDRLFLAVASRRLARETWRGFLVTPQTVLRWHRELVRRRWTRRSRGQPGRPPLDEATRALVVQLARKNPRWGYPQDPG